MREKLVPLGNKGLFVCALCFEKMENFEKAYSIMEDLCQQSPNNVRFLNEKGKVFSINGKA